LGNEIFLHGACLSSGCLPITDDKIKELYVYSVEAYNSGQEEIGLTIFPARLSDSKYNGLISGYSRDKDKTSLWGDLKRGYDLFNQTKCPPKVTFLADGGHEVL
jgi:murein L,D-transpeptidase YafK